MKKKLLMVLIPMVLMVAGTFAVWANEQSEVQPGCSKCVKAEQPAPAVQAQPGCANCPKKAAEAAPAAAPGCANCPKKAAEATPAAAPGCANCPKKSAEGNPAGAPGCANCPNKAAAATPAAPCEKCVKLQQPVQKRCCNQNQPL